MDPVGGLAIETMSAQATLGAPITEVQGHLGELVSRVRRAGRRAWRYSWFSWGFLFALYSGIIGGA
ncbi:MAG: hypothetical protein WB786_01225 [Thermoplasmata archaeon]